jgi:hypothetical protein
MVSAPAALQKSQQTASNKRILRSFQGAPTPTQPLNLLAVTAHHMHSDVAVTAL